jgi:cephalosporin hydroxylase
VTDLSQPGVSFHAADGRRLGEVIDEALLAGCRRPFLVVEDADHSFETTAAVLDFFAPQLVEGEYVVVEDGNLSDVYPERYPGHTSGPHQAIRAFLGEHPGEFEIDAARCDFFGYNVTTCSNGFLRRTGGAPGGPPPSGAPPAGDEGPGTDR